MLKLVGQNSGNKLRLLSGIILSGFILAILYHGALGSLGYHYPFNTFLFQPWDRFHDFFDTYEKSKNLDPYATLTNYFPLAYLIVYPFTLIPNIYSAAFLLLTLFICFLIWNANYYLKKTDTKNKGYYKTQIFIICCLSYPTWFCIDRANIDILVYVFCALFLITFIKKQYWLAALALAVAVSMKLFPVVFLLLYLKEKKYLAAMSCLIYSILLSLIALASFKGGFSGLLPKIAAMAMNFDKTYAVYDLGMTSSISLFSLVKVVMKYWYLLITNDTEKVYRAAVATALSYYSVLSLAAAGFLALYVLLTKQELWKDVMMIVTMLVLLPSISGDYRLIFFYLPLFLFLSKTRQEPEDRIFTILFGLLFVPKNFFMLAYTTRYAFQCLFDRGCGNIAVGGYSVMSLLNIIFLLSFLGLMIVGVRRKVINVAPKVGDISEDFLGN
jgi:hypothetical protein